MTCGKIVIGVVAAIILADVAFVAWNQTAGDDRRNRQLAQARATYVADSARWAARDSTAQAALARLRADSGRLARAYGAASSTAAAAATALQAMLGALPDSMKAAAQRALAQVQGGGRACSALLLNCEERAATAEQQAADARDRLARSDRSNKALTDSLWDANARAARARRKCGLGGAVGMGLHGIDAVAGVACRINLLPW